MALAALVVNGCDTIIETMHGVMRLHRWRMDRVASYHKISQEPLFSFHLYYHGADLPVLRIKACECRYHVSP